MRYPYTAAVAIALSVLGSSPVSGQVSNLSIPPAASSYLLVSQTFVTRTQSYYTYQAILVNTGSALTSVTAAATSLSQNITVVAGQGTLHFASVPANGHAVSTDTFTILVNGGAPFDGSQISWSFNGPFANPGSNQTVPVLSTVTLNGGGSTNPSGIGSLTYSWAIQSAPAGSTARLSNANNVIATFVPDLLGTYVVALTVNNGYQSDTNAVTISTTDAPPTANAGANQTVAVGSHVTLDGTKSSDVNSQPLSYSWSFVTIPNGSGAFLSGIRSPNPSFLADMAGSYIVGLVVNDGTLSSSQSTVTITTGNTPPVAVATATPQIATVNGLVQLDGSKSTDVDGNPLTYLWSLSTTQAPQSKATLSNPNIVNPTFTADVAGTYVAQLIVSDGTIPSQPVTVTITSMAPGPIPRISPSAITGHCPRYRREAPHHCLLPISRILLSLPTCPERTQHNLS
jgi:PKD domain